MIPTGGPVTNVLWVILIIMVLGFLGGAWLNRRRSKAIGMWLRSGLKPVGGQATWKWIRGMNSAAQVTVEGAAKPFRRMEIGYFMMTREFAPMWGYEWLRGKRDLLSARIELRDAPAYEVEIVPRGGKLQKTLDANAGAEPFTWIDGRRGPRHRLARRGRPAGSRAAEAVCGALRPIHPTVLAPPAPAQYHALSESHRTGEGPSGGAHARAATSDRGLSQSGARHEG